MVRHRRSKPHERAEENYKCVCAYLENTGLFAELRQAHASLKFRTRGPDGSVQPENPVYRVVAAIKERWKVDMSPAS